ncbi:MAG: PAS domain-containing protein [Pantanalinema sp. GBBB05]|nr:PAS domain-containing protein [Pantanalinema sp. GBBB05]
MTCISSQEPLYFRVALAVPGGKLVEPNPLTTKSDPNVGQIKRETTNSFNLIDPHLYTLLAAAIGEQHIPQLLQQLNQALEAQLQYNAANLKAAQRVTHVGYWEFDALTKQISWSEELFRIFGLTPEQPEPSMAEHLQQIHPDDRDIWSSTVQAAIQHGTPYAIEFRILRSDGAVRTIEAKAEVDLNAANQVVRLFGTCQDITERKQLEEALRTQLQKEQTLSRIILALAFEQAELSQQVRRLNQQLEEQVEARAAELRLAFYFEATLKRITDEVRDSLDEAQILQTAVEELALALNLSQCTIALTQRGANTTMIRYQYPDTTPTAPEMMAQDSEFPEFTQPLLRGEYAHYCRLPPLAGDGTTAIDLSSCLAYPIWDDQGTLGTLWLYKPPEQSFNYLELRLVQQVANQCAIALRQSHLYQAAQFHAQELESLNQMKDEFLSTVSHELRAPMANIKMATQMLEMVLTAQNRLDPRSSRYFKILKDECDRETHLINDLLDLSRLESGQVELNLTALDLNEWIPLLVKPFQERARNQDQQLSYHLAPDLPYLTTDASYLERIVTELLHNACK